MCLRFYFVPCSLSHVSDFINKKTALETTCIFFILTYLIWDLEKKISFNTVTKFNSPVSNATENITEEVCNKNNVVKLKIIFVHSFDHTSLNIKNRNINIPPKYLLILNMLKCTRYYI